MEGKDEMTKASSSLQDLRRGIYVKAKAEPSWRFWGLFVHVCKMETLQVAYAMAQERLTEERDERLQFGRPDEPQTPPWRQPEKQPPPYLARPRSARLLRQDSEGRRPASVIDLVLGRPPRDL